MSEKYEGNNIVRRIIFWNEKYCLVLLIIASFLITNSANAIESGIKITPADKDVIETAPMKIIPFSFLIINNTSDDRNISPEITLPKGWKLVIKDSPFVLNANKSSIRLINFLVPRNALAGKYNITYSVKAKNLLSSSGGDVIDVISESYNLQVIVLPINELKINLLNAPEYILAGNEYQASFSVTNESNAEKTIIIETNNQENLSSIADVKKLQLASGESKTINVTVKSDKKIKSLIKHNLILTAQMADDEKIKRQSSSSVDIIPLVNKGGERYHRLPIQITTNGNATNQEDEIDYGFQEEIYGKGTLDEDKEKNVEFLLKGQRTNNRSYREYDSYRLNYWTDNYKLGIGDNSYALSPLIANSGNGRGINGELGVGKYRFGTFYQEDKRFSPKRRSISGYINFTANEKYKVSLNYIKKLKDSEIVSLYGQLKPAKSINIILECASDRKGDYAYQIQANGSHRWVSYALQLLHAEPNYSGSYKNRDSASANITIPIWRRVKINGAFQQAKNNLDFNPKYNSAILERRYQSGINCNFFSGNSINVGYTLRTYRDQFPQPKINRDEITYRFGIGQKIKIMNISASYDRGILTDNFTNQISETKANDYRISFTPTRWLSVNVYQNIRNNTKLTGENQKNKSIGIDSNLRIGSIINYRFSYRDSVSQYTNRNSRVKNINLNIASKLWHNHRISVRGGYNIYKTYTTSNLSFEYKAPFNLPVSRKKDIGNAKGRIYNEETNQPIPNVIFILNQITAISDKNGDFFFPTIKTGSYKLYVNMSNVGVGYIANQKIPMDVNVEDNKESSIEIGVMRSIAITGKVMVYEFEDTRKNGFNSNLPNSEEKQIVESDGLGNTLIELTNGKETLRRLSNSDGSFGFERIRPGKWTLKVYEDGLPEYHYLEKGLYEFDLKPGENTEVLIKVLPKVRRIRIMKEGGAVQEEKKK